MPKLILLLVVFTSPFISAGEIQYASIEYQEGVYNLELDAIIDARHEDVYAIVTDYNRMDRLSRSFVGSSLIDTHNPGKKRRRLVTKSCILFFCFKVTIVEDIQEIDKEIILTTIVSEHSDFKSGKTKWHITAVNDKQSRIQFYCEEEPKFWVPPYIGPLLIKHQLLTIAKEAINQIEFLVNDA